MRSKHCLDARLPLVALAILLTICLTPLLAQQVDGSTPGAEKPAELIRPPVMPPHKDPIAPDPATPGGDKPAEPAPTDEEKKAAEALADQPLVRLLAHLAIRMPDDYVTLSVTRGRVAPVGWPIGDGDQIVIEELPRTAAQRASGRYGKVTISLMKDLVAYATAPADGEAAEKIGLFNDHVLLLSKQNDESWAGLRRHLSEAMRAAERPLAASLRGEKVFIGPLTSREIHLNPQPGADGAGGGLFREGSVLDLAGGKRGTFSLPSQHPLFKTVAEARGPVLMVMKRNLPAAVVALEPLKPVEAKPDEIAPPADAAAPRRVHCFISGKVQGVGYRDWTRRQAIELKLTGWVMNLRDGRVEAVVEGPKAQVDELIRRMHRGSPAARVTGVAVTDEAPTGEFRNFTRKN